ncbi:MAG: carboxypeptidase-like regulatory domain-containing protein, partial [Bacteroidia bacterium]
MVLVNRRLFSLLFFLINLIPLASAQHFFKLSGYVNDSMGQAIPGATIRLRNDNLGTATDDNGYFALRLEEG